jgi:hypothetical protein
MKMKENEPPGDREGQTEEEEPPGDEKGQTEKGERQKQRRTTAEIWGTKQKKFSRRIRDRAEIDNALHTTPMYMYSDDIESGKSKKAIKREKRKIHRAMVAAHRAVQIPRNYEEAMRSP